MTFQRPSVTKPFVCDVCKNCDVNKFSLVKQMRGHLWRYVGDRCDVCGATAALPGEYMDEEKMK